MAKRGTRKPRKSPAKLVGAAAGGLAGTLAESAVGGMTGGAFGATVGGAVGGTIERWLGGPDGAELLDDPTRALPEGDVPPSLLLRAEHEVVEFYPRRELFGIIEQWCRDESPRSARVFFGPGGIGKTRLFIHLVGKMREEGWRAGFLTRLSGRISPTSVEHLLEARTPLLIVVDYAETRGAAVLDLLRQAADSRADRRVRIILVARGVADWWTELQRIDADVQRLLMTSPRPVEVLPLARGEENRRAVFDAAVRDFGKRQGKTGTIAEPPDLASAAFENVLFIHMAALAAIERQRLDAADDLLEFSFDHERRYRRGRATENELPAALVPAIPQALALVTLAGGTDSRADTRRLVARAPLLIGEKPANINRFTALLYDLYGGRELGGDEPLEGLRPDLLGEHLVHRAVEDDEKQLGAPCGEGTLLDSLFAEANNASITHGLIVLTRLAQRRPPSSEWLRQALVHHTKQTAAPAMAVAVQMGEPIGALLIATLEDRLDA
jgi:hypothetical protein